jgi:two-component system OmpR family response regulator
VEVHISNVRKKLGRDFITTRRGHGYMVPGEPAEVGKSD